MIGLDYHITDGMSCHLLQVTPSPVNPLLQVHVKPSAVSVHTALASQLSVPSVHWSTER